MTDEDDPEQPVPELVKLFSRPRVTPPADTYEAATEFFGNPEGLLREWYDWWESSLEGPAKMPNSLAVRTACFLQVNTLLKQVHES